MSDNRHITIAAQLSVLDKYFPSGKTRFKTQTQLRWEMDVIPSPNSTTYRIRIDYTISKVPNIFVIDPPKLKRAEGQDKLPHVYSTVDQKICLYYPRIGEWKETMFIAKTLVPWASEWLFFYEIWVLTGEWKGGGIHHPGKTIPMRNNLLPI